MTYRRHREHIWTEHAINHVEEALSGPGLEQRGADAAGDLLCRSDRLHPADRGTGDEVAVQVAGRLASLVNDISAAAGAGPSGG